MVNATDAPGHFEAFKAGSKKALLYYFVLDGRKVFQYLEKKTEDAEVANELTARVFTVSFEKREKFVTESQLRPCFFHTATRLAQAHLWEKGKIDKVEIDLLFPMAGDCSAFDEAEKKRAEVLCELRGSFRNLTARKRRILVYYYFRRMSTREIAARLGIVPQTVLNHKSQALNLLKYDFRGKWGENNPFLA
jgi:RNA polymerase sigma factor (sigma-70 family)